MAETPEELLAQLEPLVARAVQLHSEFDPEGAEVTRAVNAAYAGKDRQAYLSGEKNFEIPSTVMSRVFPIGTDEAAPWQVKDHIYAHYIRITYSHLQNWRRDEVTALEACRQIANNAKSFPADNALYGLTAMLDKVVRATPEQIRDKGDVKAGLEDNLRQSIANFIPLREVMDKICALYSVRAAGGDEIVQHSRG